MVLFALLLLWPYIGLRAMFLSRLNTLDFYWFEVVRGALNFSEAFSALALFIVNYFGKVKVIPDPDYF